jgi:hypothetical protein
VHEKSFDNFRYYIAPDLYSRFTIGPYRFLRLNAFSTPRPDSFSLGGEQIDWLEQELKECESAGDRAVLLLHCYPSDLKQGGEELMSLLRRYPVLLVDMGHTHYNELSNNGRTLYSATRSTGQIEEGAVGYSVTTIDHDAVSWHFVELGSPDLVAVTHPADERLVTELSVTSLEQKTTVRVKTWARRSVRMVYVQVEDRRTTLASHDGIVWEGSLAMGGVPNGAHDLKAVAVQADGTEHSSSIRLRIGPMPEHNFAAIDHENALAGWCERGLLGTQLGPNKNVKKW